MLHHKSPIHFIVFSGIFVFIALFFVFYTVSQAVILDPKDLVHHTTVVYYDGKFSESFRREDTQTALYIVNLSRDTIYATIYEYDKSGKEKSEVVEILGGQDQFMKTEGPGTIYLNNYDRTARATLKFMRWTKFKYFIPENFKI